MLILYGATDLEIPVHNSHRLFQRAVSGTNDSSLDALQTNNQITRTLVPKEAIVYRSVNSNITMTELIYAHHNNGKFI